MGTLADFSPQNLCERFKNLTLPIRIAVIIFLGIIFLGVIFLFSTQKNISQKVSPTISTQNQTISQAKITPTINPPPEVLFETYENTSSLPIISNTLYSYTLKKDFSTEEIASLGERLGVSEIHSASNDLVILKNVKDKDSLGMLTFYPRTGRFTFQSFVGIPLDQNVENVLRTLHIADDTVTCPITFERKDTPDLTYIECHRDWNLTGLPILNALGGVNVSEDEPLSSLTVGRVGSLGVKDENIINTSTGEDSNVRPNDFNTITVAVDKAGKLWSINSNMRWIAEKRPIQKEELLTPEQALEQFRNHKSSLSLTLPAGSGIVDISRVYPDNMAQAQKATITDFLLTYLENNSEVLQSVLVPMYLIRGIAQLESGYTVRFTETIPALLDGTTSLLSLKPEGVIAGESTIQLGSFTPITPTATPQPTFPPGVTLTTTPATTVRPTNTPIGSHPTNTPIPANYSKCALKESDFNPIWDLGEMGKIGKLSYKGRQDNTLWFLPNPDLSLPSMDKIREAAREIIEAAKNIALEGLPLDSIVLDKTIVENLKANKCAFPLTISSPSLFVYANAGTTVFIKAGMPVTYSDPPISEKNNWKVSVAKDKSLLSDGYLRKFLYYEYNKADLIRPGKGWIVQKKQLDQFAKEISDNLVLLPLEKDRLLFELRHASFNIDSPDLFIGLIPEQEINKNLPLYVSPQPDSIYRLHFFVSAKKDYAESETPILKPIHRSPFMILELGAVGE